MLVISRAAEREAAEATAWYNARRDGLAREFLDELHSELEAVESNPLRFAQVQPRSETREFRQARLRRFPYLIVYEVKASNVLVVLAIAHASRRPGYWQSRT